MNILIVDDHPMVARFYESMLQESFLQRADVHTVKAFNCEQAYKTITSDTDERKFELAILDYRLPAYTEIKILNGCDIANLVRKINPNCKIVFITAQTEVLIIYDIIKKVHPEALAIKNEIDSEIFHTIIETVMQGNCYQSKMVKACSSKIWRDEIMIDDDNRKIIFHLAKGYKVKDLESVVDLSQSTIQKRIINIKKNLGISAESGLVLELTRRGFI
ncbi:hypothetical protein AMR72_15160 [Flavobacterium psychrophilum]|nr:hypothetical protein AMR72_15160 [Flavobacterium psychrophilum]AOE53737.1 hypothetical protein ALW18_15150 [Flavobacterium psychrophilum]